MSPSISLCVGSGEHLSARKPRLQVLLCSPFNAASKTGPSTPAEAAGTRQAGTAASPVLPTMLLLMQLSTAFAFCLVDSSLSMTSAAFLIPHHAQILPGRAAPRPVVSYLILVKGHVE